MGISQFDLCIEVLRRLDRAGVLGNVVLVGSWCTLFYEDYFGPGRYRALLRTRDMDLLIPRPGEIKVRTDAAELLRDLGFVVGFAGSQGYIRLEHPELIVEFLVPERGRGRAAPYPLPNLGINAQALRFMEFLAEHVIEVQAGGISVTVPHPAAFALHKLLVLSRRPSVAKKAKDMDAAVQILGALVEKGQGYLVREVFAVMPRRWKERVRRHLATVEDDGVRNILQ